MLNLFQHLTNKHRLTQDLRLLTSCEDGQMLKQVQHDKSLMLVQVVLCETINKQLNKLKIKASKKAKKQASCRTRFGIYPIINISKGFNTFNLSVHFLLFWTGDAKKKKTEPKEEKTAPTLRPNGK